MKALLALNPLIWKYRGRLFLGMVFVVFTNMFAVWAPSMIGEGVNALNQVVRVTLEPSRSSVIAGSIGVRTCRLCFETSLV